MASKGKTSTSKDRETFCWLSCLLAVANAMHGQPMAPSFWVLFFELRVFGRIELDSPLLASVMFVYTELDAMGELCVSYCSPPPPPPLTPPAAADTES